MPGDPDRDPGAHVYRKCRLPRRDKLGPVAAMAPSQRLLLLIPTTTYRTEDFVEAARALDVDLVLASDRPNVMSGEFPDHLLTLPFSDPTAAVREIRGYAARPPLDAVVPVDDAVSTRVVAQRSAPCPVLREHRVPVPVQPARGTPAGGGRYGRAGRAGA